MNKNLKISIWILELKKDNFNSRTFSIIYFLFTKLRTIINKRYRLNVLAIFSMLGRTRNKNTHLIFNEKKIIFFFFFFLNLFYSILIKENLTSYK